MERKRQLDLYDVFHILQKECGFSVEEIGKLYVSSLSSFDKKCFLSTSSGVSEATARNIKRNFQKSVRDFFYDVKNLYSIDHHSKEKIMDRFIQPPPHFDYDGSSIEGVLTRILEPGEHDYNKIGEAVIRGAKKYLSEKPSECKDGPYKFFLEYNRVFGELTNMIRSDSK